MQTHPTRYIHPPQRNRPHQPLDIIDEVKKVISSWIIIETGEIITPKTTKGGNYFTHTPKEVTQKWVEQVKQLHEVVMVERTWDVAHLNVIKRGFQQLTTQYSNMVEYHEMTYQMNRNPVYTNDYTELERRKLEFNHHYLERDLARFEYIPVAAILEVEVEATIYAWVPVKPDKLTPTQTNSLPTNEVL